MTQGKMRKARVIVEGGQRNEDLDPFLIKEWDQEWILPGQNGKRIRKGHPLPPQALHHLLLLTRQEIEQKGEGGSCCETKYIFIQDLKTYGDHIWRKTVFVQKVTPVEVINPWYKYIFKTFEHNCKNVHSAI